jgi:type I restriction enzyme S subunit
MAMAREAHRMCVDAASQASLLLLDRIESIALQHPPSGRLRDILKSSPRNGWSAHCDNLPDGVPVLGLGAVTGFRFRGEQHKRTSLPVNADAHYWLNSGDILITRSNTPELVGHVAIYDGTPHPCIYPDLMMKIEIDPRKANARFVWYWCQTSVVRKYIQARARGTSSSMRKIAQKDVMDIPFPTALPTLTQADIAAGLDILATKFNVVSQLHDDIAADLAVLPVRLLESVLNVTLSVP